MRYSIWWQSTADLREFEGYHDAIADHAKKLLAPGFELHINGLERIGKGYHSLYLTLLNARELVRIFLTAEQEGFSGIALGCFVDPALEEAREVLSIPIAGMGQASLLSSTVYGKRIAVVNNSTPEINKFITSMPYKYLLTGANFDFVGFSLTGEHLHNAFVEPQPVIDAFIESSLRAVDRGAEIIIPGCGIINALLMANGIYTIDDVPIFDTTGTLLKSVETMILLKISSGLGTSRKGFYSSPPRHVIVEDLDP